MRKFVKFYADGVVYDRNTNDRPCKVKERHHARGIINEGADFMGKIFKKCPELLPCDWVNVRTYRIG